MKHKMAVTRSNNMKLVYEGEEAEIYQLPSGGDVNLWIEGEFDNDIGWWQEEEEE